MLVEGGLSWEVRAAAKRSSTSAKIPKEWRLDLADLERASRQRDLTGPFIEQFLSSEEVAITRRDSVSIVTSLRQGDISAEQVTRAFCKAAATAHQINNCLHEIFFDQALQRAKELDEYFVINKKTMGPLHGLPISLKDQFHVAGLDTTMGYIGWIDTFEGSKDPRRVHKINSQIVLELLSLGAVLYCKTSLPQTLLFGETVNNLIGKTMNPVNQHVSCGGSSGGEAALQALRGSSVGIGTDIGGSVRIPAAFCGGFAIKPSHLRFPYRDVANVNPGQTTYASSVGFLGSSLGALHLLMASILSTSPWLRDPTVVSIPWRQDITNATLQRAAPDGSANDAKPLKIGIFWTDGVVTPQPPIIRGLRLVVDAVKNAGHKTAMLHADGGHDIHGQLDLSGEPLIPQLRTTFKLKDPTPLLEYQALTMEGRDYESAYSDYWNTTAEKDGQLVDAVIMPVAPHAAVIPGKYFHATYTQAINLMDYSAVVIPVTRADKNVDIANVSFTPLNDLDAKNWEAYDRDTYDGAPVGIQIVGRKYEEEKIWAVSKIVYTIMESRHSRQSGQ